MPLSNAATSGVYATSSDIVALVLLTFKLEGFDDLRVVNNTVDIESRGLTYEAFPFKVKLLQEDTERLPEVTLQIDNIDGRIMQYIRSLPKAPTLTLEVVTSADNFQSPERSVDFLKLTQVGYNALAITGTLVLDNFMAARYPAHDYTPAEFPALFGVILGERRTIFAPTDPYYNFVNSILLFEDNEGSTLFHDETGYGDWTRWNGGNSGDAIVVSGDSKEGTKALRMVNPNTANGVFRRNDAMKGAPNSAKICQGQAYTIEGWFKPTGWDNNRQLGICGLHVVDGWGGKYVGWRIIQDTPNTGHIAWFWSREDYNHHFTHAKITLNIWSHIAIVHNGVGRVSVFINGKLMETRYIAVWADTNTSFDYGNDWGWRIGSSVGQDGGFGWKGLMDAIRISTVARYWEDFTPQTKYQTAQGTLEISDVMRDVNSPSNWFCGLWNENAPAGQQLHMDGDDLVIPAASAGDQMLFREGAYLKDGYVLLKSNMLQDGQLMLRTASEAGYLGVAFIGHGGSCALGLYRGNDHGGAGEIAIHHLPDNYWQGQVRTILAVLKGGEVSVTVDGTLIFDRIDVSNLGYKAGKVQLRFPSGSGEHRIQEFHISTDPDAAPTTK